jgi:hypothetical protein
MKEKLSVVGRPSSVVCALQVGWLKTTDNRQLTTGSSSFMVS